MPFGIRAVAAANANQGVISSILMNDTAAAEAPNQKQNADPITGEPGAHPVATGIGAAAAGTTGLAVAVAVAGPVGVAAAVVGATIAGGLAGKAAGELLDPTEEDAFWREEHPRQPYASDAPYDDYAASYRSGYMGFVTHGVEGKTFEEAEPHLRAEYEVMGSSLSWERARPAIRLAWDRAHQRGARRIQKDASGAPRVEDANERANEALVV